MGVNQKQEEHILRNESYSRRDNLVFRGFTVADNDREDASSKVRNIIKHMGLDETHIPFVRCHYLNGKRQIIVRFQWYSDREKVWQNRYKLKNSNFYVAEDFPAAIEAERKQLYPVLKAAKALPEYHRKATLRGNQLILDGKHFTTKTISNVPKSVHPEKLAQKSNDQVLVFGGSTSAHHGLSNFSYIKGKFVYDHIAYNTAEQAFQHAKARKAGDQNTQREIMFHTDPATQRNLGQNVKGLDEAEWERVKCGTMKDILLAKFIQTDTLKKQLLDTKNLILAEANGRDRFFGIGLPLTHPDVLNPNKWSKDGNRLGKMLMEIREELKK